MSRPKRRLTPKKLRYSRDSPERSESVIANKTEKLHLSISDILKKKWRVFRVSPIYNFNSKWLKLYGNKLCQELKGKKRFNFSVTYKSSFTLNERFEVNKDFIKVLQVEVTANDSRKVYLGYFISVTDSMENIQDCASLPILLADGKGQELSDIHSSLCKIFDCDIQPVTFSFQALITFFVKGLESVPKGSDVAEDVLHLEYKIPGLNVKNNLKVTLTLKDATFALAIIIDRLREKLFGIQNMDIIFEFYKRILNHLYNIYSIDLSKTELCKIDFPYASLSADGQLKISSQDAASVVFFILQLFTPLTAVLNIENPFYN